MIFFVEENMFRLSCFRPGMILISICLSGTAAAKLPPPSPQQLAAAQAAKEKAAADAASDQAALETVQDRIAAEYAGRKKASGVAVTPTAGAGSTASEVPSAALEIRPVEKSGAYHQAITPSSVQSTSSASSGTGASGPQAQ